MLYNDKSCSRGMPSAIEGRGERGIWACVFKEFTLRCKETWSPIIDRTYSLLLNLLTRQRLPLNKYYSNLSFLNQFRQNSFPAFSSRLHPRWRLPILWSLWIGLPPSCIRNVGGPWAGVWPIPNQMIEEALIWTLKDSLHQNAPIIWFICRQDLEGALSLP